MKKIIIAIFSTSRADFGILIPLLKKLKENKNFEVKFYAGGSHYMKSHGSTYKEILSNKIKINNTFPFKFDSNKDEKFIKNIVFLNQKLMLIFKKNKFDYICLLGDRIELLPIVIFSIINRIELIHIGGGEETLGAIDNKVRNILSQVASKHFTTSYHFSKKLELMGINKKNIHEIGLLSIDSIKNFKRINKDKLYKHLNLNIKKKTILFTYHPETTEKNFVNKRNINLLLKILNKQNYQIVITLPNYDLDKDSIIKQIKLFAKKNSNFQVHKSLGFKKYHNLVQFCEFIIGNSSSGIMEVPYYKIPTINVGSRQLGRYRHPSIIDVDYKENQIKKAIKKVVSKKFKKQIKKMKYLFGDGNASKKIIKQLLNFNKR
jgi:GDP/UDP-N,N'-diacetylbacillosamine 2-epimerase (hydrolysing)